MAGWNQMQKQLWFQGGGARQWESRSELWHQMLGIFTVIPRCLMQRVTKEVFITVGDVAADEGEKAEQKVAMG